MIIKKAIFAVDDNPKYSGLWPIVSEICFKKLGIVPVLFHITEEDSDFYEDEYGLVKKVKRIPDIDAGKQSQIIRMWGTRYFPEEVCIISDIDMMMFNREYFLDQVIEYSEDDLVIYCSDAYDPDRPECVGIYSDRYPIAYNAAKGRIFDQVLNTDCGFDEYIRRVLDAGFPDFDSDEMYYTYCVDNKEHGVNVVKLKRGFYSKFKCPRRIDRVDDSIFNKYDERLISNGHYVDCHLARPESRYKDEMNLLRDKILKTNEVYLIGCHIDTPKQLSLLSELVGKLIDEGKNYIIVSHTLVPEFIIKNSIGFIYDSVNPTHKTWEIENPNKYVIDYGNVRVESPYITYGRRDYYHVGVLRLLLNGLRYIKTLSYDIVHWIEYDALPDFEEEGKNVKRLMDSDFIFYGIGSKFSFKTSSISKSFIESTDKDLLRILSENEYVAEKVISENLIDGKKIAYDVGGIDKFYGRHSHNSEMLFDWSIYDDNGTVCIFVDNKGSVNLKLTLRYSENIINIECHPRTWAIRPISERNRLGDFSIESMGNVIVNLDLTDDLIYERMVKSVSVEIR